MAAYTVETLTIGQIYGGTGGPGGAGGEEGGQGGTGQGNTFTVNAQNAVFNNPGVGVQNAAAILDWFSPLNFNPRHQTISQTRAQDTGNWLLVHPQFKAWKESQGAWLWCKGDPGVGKTFLASLVVDHLLSESSVQVAFLYLNHKETETQTPQNILAAIWSQFMQEKPLPPNVLDIHKGHMKNKTRPQRKQLVDLLNQFLSTHSQVFLVVDALDEYPEDNRWALMKDLDSLGSQLNVLVTSRPNIRLLRSSQKILTLDVLANPRDIHQFISEFIENSPALSAQVRRSSEVEALVHDEVYNAAHGMFLLVKLHLEALQKDRTIGLLKHHLSTLPQTVEDTYQEAIARIQSQAEEDVKFAHRALLWILYAKRPLVSGELEVAVNIKLRNSSYDKDFQPAVEDILAVCAGLIALDVGTLQIRVVHYTAQEFLPGILKCSAPHKTISVALLTLLNGPQFKLYLEKRNGQELQKEDGGALLNYAGYCLLHAQRDQQTDILDLLQTFMKEARAWHSAMMPNWVGIKIWRSSMWNNPHYSPLWLAAGANLLDLVKILMGAEQALSVKQALVIAAEQGSLHVLEYLMQQSQPPTYEAFYSACSSGQLDTVKLLVEYGAPIHREGCNALSAASEHSLTIVDYLIALGQDLNLRDQQLKITPLLAAIRKNHLDIVQFLIGHGADVNALGGGHFGSPLQGACWRGSIEIVQLLLEHNADVTLLGGGYYGSPLQAACWRNSIEIVQLLLDHGAAVNYLGGGHFGSPLQVACAEGTIELVQFLIDHGADVTTLGGGFFGSPLQAACIGGHIKIVQLLVNHGADVNILGGGYFGSPLQAACASGSIKIVQLLIDYDADISHFTNSHFGSPLQAACWMGSIEILKLLIARGADINMTGVGDYGSSLQTACAEAELEIVQFLLAQGTDVNMLGGGKYGSPLQAASSSYRNSLKIVECLLVQGAQVNQPTNGLYTTPLDAAYCYGQNTIWNILLSYGADPLAALSTEVFL